MTRYRKEIADAAASFQLDPLLVEAIVMTESSGNTDGFRFEPAFYNRYLKPKKMFPGQNPRRISSSYGLMQIMYPVAIERGYPVDESPERLFIPEVGLYYGCKHLRVIFDRMAQKFPDHSDEQRLVAILASYNGGFQGPDALRPANHTYAKKVLQAYAALTSVTASTS